MDHLLNILEGTPWWVYVLFIYLLSIGIKGTQPRGVPIKQMVLLPLILTAWSLYAFLDHLQGRYEFLALWASAAFIGGYLALHWVKKLKLSVDKVKGIVYLRGSPVNLILILAIFFTRYIFGYLYATSPDNVLDSNIFGVDTCVSGLIIGFFLGRSITIWIRYQNSIE